MTHAHANRTTALPASYRHRPAPPVRLHTPGLRLQAKPGCSCGGACPACRAAGHAHAEAQATEATLMREPMEEEETIQTSPAGAVLPTIQPKLKIGAPDDTFEREADEVADQVMRMTDEDVVQAKADGTRAFGLDEIRRQPMEEEEEMIQAKGADGPARATPAASAAIAGLSGGGRPLPAAARAFFEPRFGSSFSHVRIHDGSKADTAARAVGARAFTLGRDVAFASGEFSPATSSGRHLIAHELTHVVQQDSGTAPGARVQRRVGTASICAAGTGGAPADAMDQLRAVDALATSMSLGTSMSLELESMLFADPTFGPGVDFESYSHWFDTPRQQPDGRWRSRFRRATFATENEATRHEMETFSARLARVSRWLAGNVRYRCTGDTPFTIPGCSAQRCGTAAAQTCPTGSRTVRICPNFWLPIQTQDRVQAGYLIHEALHPLFDFREHKFGTPAERAANPGCYQGFVHEAFGDNLLPGDCTRLP